MKRDTWSSDIDLYLKSHKRGLEVKENIETKYASFKNWVSYDILLKSWKNSLEHSEWMKNHIRSRYLDNGDAIRVFDEIDKGGV